MILDLSHGVQINGEQMQLVNEVTDKTILPAHSMAELGNVLPHIIYAVRMAHESKGPILFSKLDIKDGYWRMVFPAEDEWNFAFVLPKANPQEPTTLVIPASLQMGWIDSPAFFSSALEMACDIATTLESNPLGLLPTPPPGTIPDAIGKLLHPNIGCS
jgi:hypothetical protein